MGNVVIINNKRRKKYGLFNFLVDATMTLLTAGLWIIWVFCREMRNR